MYLHGQYDHVFGLSNQLRSFDTPTTKCAEIGMQRAQSKRDGKKMAVLDKSISKVREEFVCERKILIFCFNGKNPTFTRMKIIILIISLFLLNSYEVMSQSVDKNLVAAVVTDFDTHLSDYLKKYPQLEALTLLNPGQTVYPPGNDVMPINPYYYKVTEKINQFKNLKHLRLQCLYVLDLPNNITKCKLETLAIPFCPDSDMESIVGKLKKCRYLKEIDLVNVVLSDDKIAFLKKSLPHVKFVNLMDDLSFDNEVEN